MKTRNISGLEVMDGMEFCAKIGVEKGTNGYPDKNKLVGTLSPGENGYIGNGPNNNPPSGNNPGTSGPTGNFNPAPWAQGKK